jgi:integrase
MMTSRRSNNNKSVAATTDTLTDITMKGVEEDNLEIQRKISLATDGFTATNKFCELILRDRNRISKENALTVSNYIIAMKHEINARPNTIRTAIQFLAELSKSVGIEKKKFEDMSRDDILLYLDSNRKLENEDPLHKWIGSYNVKRMTIFRFFKWLQYPDVDSSKRRSELSAEERKPECIIGIPQLKRKEVSCYKPSDLWTQDDDLVFLKWVTNKRDRCYHIMSRDLSARPHEILNLKIKDVIFKNANGYQYAEVLVNGKTGSRHIPLIQSIPYLKDWLSNHPSRNNTKSPLFVSMDKRSMGRKQLTLNGLYSLYGDYKDEFFPKLLEDPTVSNEDKEKIKDLLQKPFNPYIRRHSALTEKSTKLKSNTLNQHAGWSMNSSMAQKYIHYFGNESSESILEAYGIVTKNNVPIDTLNPKICPNCNEGNTQDAKFCSKCKMIMSFEGYQAALESEKQRETELEAMKEQFNNMQDQVSKMSLMYEKLILSLEKSTDKHQINDIIESNFEAGAPKPSVSQDGVFIQKTDAFEKFIKNAGYTFDKEIDVPITKEKYNSQSTRI